MQITEDTHAQLRRYAEILSEANTRARLTGPTDADTIYRELVADALYALPYLEPLPGGSRFVDVGTGGGLPGMVWGICRPDLYGVLLDSIGKKAALVREMADSLGCRNIEVRHERSEAFALREREGCDVATAKAVATSCVLAEYLSPLVRTGGRLIAFKGPGAPEEVDIPRRKWGELGLSEPQLHPYVIQGRERFLVIWEKTHPCPRRYPRQPGMAEKHPWCVSGAHGRAPGGE